MPILADLHTWEESSSAFYLRAMTALFPQQAFVIAVFGLVKSSWNNMHAPIAEPTLLVS